MPYIVAAGQYWWHERSNRYSLGRSDSVSFHFAKFQQRTDSTNFRVVFIHRLKVLEAKMLPVVSCFKQVYVFLVIRNGQAEQARGCVGPPQRDTQSAVQSWMCLRMKIIVVAF